MTTHSIADGLGPILEMLDQARGAVDQAMADNEVLMQRANADAVLSEIIGDKTTHADDAVRHLAAGALLNSMHLTMAVVNLVGAVAHLAGFIGELYETQQGPKPGDSFRKP